MATQKMSNLSIINAVNFKSGTIKRVDAVNLAAIAAGQPLESLLPLFNFSGYSMRVVSYSPEAIRVLVFEHKKTDKDKTVVITQIMSEANLTLSKLNAWQSDTIFSSADASKLAKKVAKELWNYPLIPMGDLGLYPKDKLVPTLAAIISDKYGMKSDVSTETAVAMLAYAVDKPALSMASPAKICQVVETEAMQSTRLNAWLDKEDKKQLASATTQDDKF